MVMSAKSIKKQLAFLKPLLDVCSLETCRRGQNKIGEIMRLRNRGHVIYKEHSFDKFVGVWTIPKDERRQGVILYLHGGGYTCGDVEYVKGFGTTLAAECGTKVFSAVYRLAPENRFPCAVEDALDAYDYLISKGYAPSHITLCGESAGGGLCYSLCLKLKEQGRELPCGIIAVSPWVDMTLSGESYEENCEKDPSMTKKVLDFFADSYTDDRENIFVSPLLADLSSMPPSLIFAGGDEIMLDDARRLHSKLLGQKCKSRLIVAPERWHAYVLYSLRENESDYKDINIFLNKYMSEEKKLRWMRLDNAAKIYPAARHRNWSNVFRESVTFREEVDRAVLQSALDVTARRFPSIAAKLKKGLFWYYIEELSEAPQVRDENSYPLARMNKRETRKCALRVIAYKNRVAIECFHSLTDGNGALIFLKTLAAEYIQQKYGVYVPAENGVLGRLEDPSEEELEDSFFKYSGKVTASRRGKTAYHLSGTRELGGFLNQVCFKLPVKRVIEEAHKYNVSLTVFICAVMMQAIQRLQEEQVTNPDRRRPVKVLIPVDLRRIFESKSLRNFVLYTTPEIDPKLGEYSFEEICKAVYHRMGLEVNPKFMSSVIATNVGDEKLLAVKLMPLFVKNAVMKMVFNAVGECKSCLCLSNLGAIKVPEVMEEYIERFDFILGVQSNAPHNCGVVSYKDTLYINFIRNIQESDLEMHFFKVLRDMDIPVTVESNYSGRD